MTPIAPRVAFAATILFLGTAPALRAQTTLALDGQTVLIAATGSTVVANIGNGQPGMPCALMVDVSPGPTTVLGVSIPLGLTPQFAAATIGVFPPGGTLSTNIKVPSHEVLHGVTAYFAALSFDTGQPSGLAVSNRADLKIVTRPQLAGNPLATFPFFEHVAAINRQSPVSLGIDPRFSYVAGKTADLYVVAHKTPAQWQSNPALVDARGAPQTVTFPAAATTIQQNTFQLDAGALPGPNEAISSGDTRIGVAYDVVIDFGQNATFDPAVDMIDGYDNDEAGFYVCRDLGRGGLATATTQGPYPVSTAVYTGGSFLGQITYYPSNIATLGQLPLVVISHGNGHNYQWYNHYGYHLASYGFVVMSHENNTVPGSHTAATSTLQNTDYILANLATIAGGVLNGHIDTSKILWIGHSRGGDGVARAYDQLFRGVVTPVNYTIASIKLVSSMAPVDFGGWDGAQPTLGGPGNGSHPHNANFHLWVAQSDSDVHGCASQKEVFWYNLYERATNKRQSISLYGVGHGDLHDGTGGAFAAGPNLVGKATTHAIMRPYVLALCCWHARNDYAARDYLWRQYESFRAFSAPPLTTTGVTVNMTLHEDSTTSPYVIDNFQNQSFASPNVATSGANVTIGVQSFVEGRQDDANGDFTANVNDPFNGFTYDEMGTPAWRSDGFACVFGYDGTSSPQLTYDLTNAANRPNFRDYQFLSFRAAQASRHPHTAAVLADLTFSVALEDEAGNRSTINIGTYGGGIEEPYQRNVSPTCGTGNGWNSEYETIRIRLTDFLNNGSTVDLSKIRKVAFCFGPTFGSTQGRLGLDDIELNRK
ncbi:MAG: hypothetical protein WAT39_25280 [Planctomycetota bacterium]